MIRRSATIAFLLIGIAVGTRHAFASDLPPSGDLQLGTTTLSPGTVGAPSGSLDVSGTTIATPPATPLNAPTPAVNPGDAGTPTAPAPQTSAILTTVKMAKAVMNVGCTIYGRSSPSGQAVSSSGGIDAILDQTTNPSHLLTRSSTNQTGGATLSQGAYRIATYLWSGALVFSLALWFIKHFRPEQNIFGMLNNIEAKLFGVGCSFLLMQYAAGEGAFQSNGGPAIVYLSGVVDNVALNLAQYIVAPSTDNSQLPVTTAGYRINTPGDAFRAGTCLAWRTVSGPKAAALASIAEDSPNLQDAFTSVIDGLAAAASSWQLGTWEWVAGLLNLVPFTILAFQLFLVKWAGIVFGAAAIILLGFSVLEVTAPWAESYWKFLFGNLMSNFTIVFVAYFIAALMDAVQMREFQEITNASSQNVFVGLWQAGTAPLTGLIDNIFVSLFATGIALSTPSLTSILTSGSGGLSGGNVLAVFGLAASALAGGVGALTGATKALTAATKANTVAKGVETATEGAAAVSETANRVNGPLVDATNGSAAEPVPADWNADAPDRPSATFDDAESMFADADAPASTRSNDRSFASASTAEQQDIDEAREVTDDSTVLAEEQSAEAIEREAQAAETLASGTAESAGPPASGSPPTSKPTRLQAVKDAIGGVRAAHSQAMKAATSAEAGVALQNLSKALENFTNKTAEYAESATAQPTVAAGTSGSSVSTPPASGAGEATGTEGAGTGQASAASQPVADGSRSSGATQSTAGASTPAGADNAANRPTVTQARSNRPPSSSPADAKQARQVQQTALASGTLQSCAQSLAAAAPFATGAAAAPFGAAAASLANAATMLTANGMTPQAAQAMRAAQADYAAATVSLAQTGSLPTPVSQDLGAANAVLETEAAMVTAISGDAPIQPGDVGTIEPQVQPTLAADQPPPDAFVTLMERTFSAFEATNAATIQALNAVNKTAVQQQKSMQQVLAAGPQGVPEKRTASKEQAAGRKTFLQQLSADIATNTDRARRLHTDHHHAGAAPRSSGIHH